MSNAMMLQTEVETRTPAVKGSDAELVQAMRDNVPSAFETFVRQNTPRMLATARRMLRCDEDCQDAVQRAFIAAFQSIRRFEGHSTLATWLHRIVVNVCLMHLRKKGERSQVSIDSLLPRFDDSGHHAHLIPAWDPLPDEELETEECRALVRHSIDMLPDDYRTVLILRDIEECSTEETAEQLGTTVGAVKTRLHRARQALRTLLTPHFAT
jgi:RNA polymerase sigma-70 factor (ECF subfamily)